jgi:hypothetical protein
MWWYRWPNGIARGSVRCRRYRDEEDGARSMVSCLLTAGLGPAMADDLRGDLQVMRPNGTVLRLSSPSVDGWWDDYYRHARHEGSAASRAADG